MGATEALIVACISFALDGFLVWALWKMCKYDWDRIDKVIGVLVGIAFAMALILGIGASVAAWYGFNA